MANTKLSRSKGCGCLIGTSVINFEIERRKKALRLEEINKKLKNLKAQNKIKELKEEKNVILKDLKEVHSNKKQVKSRFDAYIKESGYVPPKLKINLKNKGGWYKWF